MDIERSYKPISKDDLFRLAIIAREDRDLFFDHYPKWERLYGNRMICVALCQGAAMHYIDGKTGVKDFDVWTFYKQHPDAPFPYRRIGKRDFGKSKFGWTMDNSRNWEGRRVDCIGRSINTIPTDSPIDIIWAYLKVGKTKSAIELSEKAVVLLEPMQFLGKVVWPKFPLIMS